MQDNAGKAHFYAVYKVNRKEKRKEEKRYFEKKTEKKENFVYVHIPDISVYLCTDFDCGSVQTG